MDFNEGNKNTRTIKNKYYTDKGTENVHIIKMLLNGILIKMVEVMNQAAMHF